MYNVAIPKAVIETKMPQIVHHVNTITPKIEKQYEYLEMTAKPIITMTPIEHIYEPQPEPVSTPVLPPPLVDVKLERNL